MNSFTLFFATAVYYFIHSLLADNSVKQWVKRKIIAQQYYRLFYNFVAVSLLIPLVWMYFTTPKQALFNNTLYNQIIGIMIILVGIWLTKKAMAQYNLQEFIGIDRLRSNENTSTQFLNTTGLNSWVRHPLYFASLLILWGSVLAFPNSGVLAIVICSTLYLFVGIRLEEKKLIHTFGTSYLDYQKRVPMILPRLKRSRKRL